MPKMEESEELNYEERIKMLLKLKSVYKKKGYYSLRAIMTGAINTEKMLQEKNTQPTMNGTC